MNKTVDLSFLETFTSGNRDKMKKYISMFLQLCPTSLNNMKAHVEKQDYDALRATAHAIKPQITYMGIKEGETLVKSIEHNAATNTAVESLPGMVAEFDSICRKAMEELSAAIA